MSNINEYIKVLIVHINRQHSAEMEHHYSDKFWQNFPALAALWIWRSQIRPISDRISETTPRWKVGLAALKSGTGHAEKWDLQRWKVGLAALKSGTCHAEKWDLQRWKVGLATLESGTCHAKKWDLPRWKVGLATLRSGTCHARKWDLPR